MPPKDRMNVFDFSQFEFVPVSDSDTAFNGTWKFNYDMMSPWRIEFHLQKYDRGEWLLQLKKTYANFCPELRNPLHPGNFILKHIPACPIKAQVSLKFKFFLIENSSLK